jgi:hypothetical protein
MTTINADIMKILLGEEAEVEIPAKSKKVSKDEDKEQAADREEAIDASDSKEGDVTPDDVAKSKKAKSDAADEGNYDFEFDLDEDVEMSLNDDDDSDDVLGGKKINDKDDLKIKSDNSVDEEAIPDNRGKGNSTATDNEQIKGKYSKNKRPAADSKEFDDIMSEIGAAKEDAGAEEENDRIKANYKDNGRKDLPPQYKVKVTEGQLDAMFGDSDLSEEFKNKVSALFELAVTTNVNNIVKEERSKIHLIYKNKLNEAVKGLVSKLDGYLA